jgi:hypothetical protein
LVVRIGELSEEASKGCMKPWDIQRGIWMVGCDDIPDGTERVRELMGRTIV